jgi:hypothetical protein
MQSLPPETKSHTHIGSEEEFIDFCETHSVPKKVEIFYRETKEKFIQEVLREVKMIKKTIGDEKTTFQRSLRPNPLLLDLERTMVSHFLGTQEWIEKIKKNKTMALNIYIDNSSSISFSRRLDLARSLAILLTSFKKMPRLKVFFFAESIKELSWIEGSLEDFLKQYLSMRGAGYTDLSKALKHLEAQYRNGIKAKTIFISDGVSSVGSKQVNLHLPLGKIHYLKLSGRTTVIDEALMKVIKQNKGRTVHIKSGASLVKPLYQVIKRL